MTLRVPLAKAKVSGLRRLSSRKEMDAALAKLRGRSRAKRTMWSRRAQEYQAKIASGDPASIAEVVRDLYRNVGQPEQSYSERQIYQAALDRLRARIRRCRADRRDDRDPARRADADRLIPAAQQRAARARVTPTRRGAKRRPVARRQTGVGRRGRSMARPNASPASMTGSASVFATATGSSISAIISAMARRCGRRSTSCSISAAAFWRGRNGFACDVVFLRGAQEEMWQKLLQLQFAPNPGEVLGLDGASRRRGDGARLWRRFAAGFCRDARRAAHDHPLDQRVAHRDERRARATPRCFARCVMPPTPSEGGAAVCPCRGRSARPLTAQGDAFWWGRTTSSSWTRRSPGSAASSRGFDRDRRGLVEGEFARLARWRRRPRRPAAGGLLCARRRRSLDRLRSLSRTPGLVRLQIAV